MKIKAMLLSGLFLIPFFSCENREEFSIVQVETELVAKIQVVTEPEISPGLKSQYFKDRYFFTGSSIFCIAQNEELGKPLCTVQNIKPRSGCKLLISDVGSEGNILAMKLLWGFKRNDEISFAMQDEIDLSLLPATRKNGGIEIDLSGAIDPFVNCIDCNPTCMYRLDIAGSADFSVPAQISLIIPVSAEKKIYHVQFSLF
jgi:hypothetical protein